MQEIPGIKIFQSNSSLYFGNIDLYVIALQEKVSNEWFLQWVFLFLPFINHESKGNEIRQSEDIKYSRQQNPKAINYIQRERG